MNAHDYSDREKTLFKRAVERGQERATEHYSKLEKLVETNISTEGFNSESVNFRDRQTLDEFRLIAACHVVRFNGARAYDTYNIFDTYIKYCVIEEELDSCLKNYITEVAENTSCFDRFVTVVERYKKISGKNHRAAELDVAKVLHKLGDCIILATLYRFPDDYMTFLLKNAKFIRDAVSAIDSSTYYNHAAPLFRNLDKEGYKEPIPKDAADLFIAAIDGVRYVENENSLYPDDLLDIDDD